MTSKTVCRYERLSAPFAKFTEWFALAKEKEGVFPNAVSLATATADGMPSVRMVLMQHYDERGFAIYTNTNSRKGSEMVQNPNVAMLFYWKECRRQVRIEGAVELVSNEEADAYWNSRPYGNQIAARVSDQSSSLGSREELEARFHAEMERFPEGPNGEKTERPKHWTGFRLKPKMFEFWEEGDHRLHNRFVYTHVSQLPEDAKSMGWEVQCLFP